MIKFFWIIEILSLSLHYQKKQNNMSNQKLIVGDIVNWRGRFGKADALPAKVIKIERVALGEKYGESVTEMDWKEVQNGRAVVDLDNGHFARGNQLSPIPILKDKYVLVTANDESNIGVVKLLTSKYDDVNQLINNIQ